MKRISDAVILMAGSGSRLRIARSRSLKPLIPIHGKPLVGYTIDEVIAAGVRRIIAVVGFEAETLMAGVRSLVPPNIALEFVHNPEWTKQNGVSVLAAEPYLDSPFLLTMSDHLFDRSIIEQLSREFAPSKTNITIDRKVTAIFDLDDAMKVQLQEDRVVAIAKNLSSYNAIDAGAFVCNPEIFDYLRRAKTEGDCSIADGMRLMANAGKVRGIDIGGAWWQDVDTPEMLAEAELKIGSGQHRPDLLPSA